MRCPWKAYLVGFGGVAVLALLAGCPGAPVAVVGAVDGEGVVDVTTDGTTATLKATPSPGWCFDRWEWPDGTSADNPYRIPTADLADIVAYFVEGPTVVGEGSVDIDPPSFSEEVFVTLKATAGSGWRFDHWEHLGDVSEENPHDVRTTWLGCYTATFVQLVELTVRVEGNGEVTIDGEDAGLQDPIVMDVGSERTLTAEADPGWRFDRWEGAGEDTPAEETSITVTVDEDSAVTAVFVELASLTVTVDGSGSVQIEGIGTAGTEAVAVDAGVEQTLTAVAADGWRFDHWEGDVTDTANPLTLSVAEHTSLEAHFAQMHTLTVMVLTDAGDEFFSDDDPASETFTGSGNYDLGTAVALQAHIPAGWEFDRWLSSDGSTAGIADPASPATTVSVDRDLTITSIVIDRTRQYELSIAPDSSADGVPFVTGATQLTLAANVADCDFGLAVAPRGYFLACWSELEDRPPSEHPTYGGVPVRNTFYHGEAVTLSACNYVIQAGDATFSGQTEVSAWSGDAESSTHTVTLIMDEDKVLRAIR
ncbi:MAG TPA: hypothetical protein PKK06_03940 [Phycisphaerae bacterium]|nr:hypothetical protein [Phycisphaerae bacterium]HNU44907.1 hypothetical protein [Phycisphaerae bacterium]